MPRIAAILEPRRRHRTVIWISIAQAGSGTKSITQAADDARFLLSAFIDPCTLPRRILSVGSLSLPFFA